MPKDPSKRPWKDTAAYKRLMAATHMTPDTPEHLPVREAARLSHEYADRFKKDGGRSASSWLSYQLRQKALGRRAVIGAAKAASPDIVFADPIIEPTVVAEPFEGLPPMMMPHPNIQPVSKDTPKRKRRAPMPKAAQAAAPEKKASKRRGPSKRERALEMENNKIKEDLKRSRSKLRGTGRGRKPKGFMDGVKHNGVDLAKGAAIGYVATDLAGGREVMGVPAEVVAGVALAGLRPQENAAAAALVAVGVQNYRIRKRMEAGGEEAAKVLAPHVKALAASKDPKRKAAAGRYDAGGAVTGDKNSGLAQALGRHADI